MVPGDGSVLKTDGVGVSQALHLETTCLDFRGVEPLRRGFSAGGRVRRKNMDVVAGE